jgi:Amino acid synthesis
MRLEIRKLVTVCEEVRLEGGRRDGEPLRKVAAAAIVANPYAGLPFSEDLSQIVDPSDELGELLGSLALAELRAPAESYGKAALVGADGEQEHAVAIKTSVFGDAFREAIGGAVAWLPSVSKRCAPGTPVDVPLCFKDEIWVRSHYDSITVAVPDAPLAHEIVLVAALASRGRLNARLGGKSRDQAIVEQQAARAATDQHAVGEAG